jgi:hypothetical protein
VVSLSAPNSKKGKWRVHGDCPCMTMTCGSGAAEGVARKQRPFLEVMEQRLTAHQSVPSEEGSFLRDSRMQMHALSARQQLESDLIAGLSVTPRRRRDVTCLQSSLGALNSGEWAASQLTYPCRPHRHLAPTTGDHTSS